MQTCKMCCATLDESDKKYKIHEGVACDYCYAEDKDEPEERRDIEAEYEAAYSYDAIPN